MGRGSGKVTLKQIQNEKIRNASFFQRKKGLTKKVSEFSKSFGVEACLIVYDDDGKPIIWPQDFKTLQSMLTKYQQQKFQTTSKEFKVEDYFANKKNLVELEILRVRKKFAMKKYPTWGRCLNNLGREQLKGFIDVVDSKIQTCNQRINMLKNTAHIQKKVASPQSSQPMKPIIDINEITDFTDLIKWDDLKPHENFFSSQSSQLDVMHSIPQIEPIPTPLKPHDDINEMVDLTNLIEWNDLMPQENVLSSHSNQVDVMNSIPQIQAISTPLKPHDNINEMVDLTDLIEWNDLMPQENVLSSHSNQVDVMNNIPQIQAISTPLKPLDNINEMVDFTKIIEWWDDPMPQKNVFSSHSSQLDIMHSIPQMQPITTPLKPLDNICLPLPSVSSTCQLGEFGKLDDLMDKPEPEWVATQFDFDDSAANKLNDGDGWVVQPDMFQWNDISFLSEIEQEYAALDAFPQPRYGF